MHAGGAASAPPGNSSGVHFRLALVVLARTVFSEDMVHLLIQSPLQGVWDRYDHEGRRAER